MSTIWVYGNTIGGGEVYELECCMCTLFLSLWIGAFACCYFWDLSALIFRGHKQARLIPPELVPPSQQPWSLQKSSWEWLSSLWLYLRKSQAIERQGSLNGLLHSWELSIFGYFVGSSTGMSCHGGPYSTPLVYHWPLRQNQFRRLRPKRALQSPNTKKRYRTTRKLTGPDTELGPWARPTSWGTFRGEIYVNLGFLLHHIWTTIFRDISGYIIGPTLISKQFYTEINLAISRYWIWGKEV